MGVPLVGVYVHPGRDGQFRNRAVTGQAANVRITVYDSAGNVQIAATNTPSGNAITESTDAGATANTGVYLARFTCDTTWLPIHYKMTIVGQTGVSASAVIGTDRAAALADGYSAARAGKLDFLTGDAFARLGAPAGASVSADIAANLGAIGGLPSSSAIVTALFAKPLESGTTPITFIDLCRIMGAYIGGNTDGTSLYKALGDPTKTRITYSVNGTTKARTITINLSP